MSRRSVVGEVVEGEDRDGGLWLACGNAGVWKYDGKKVTKYALGDGAYAIKVFCDREGRVWSGTAEHGVYTFDGASFVPFAPFD